jgi:putative ABC transport system substrate-binding protein
MDAELMSKRLDLLSELAPQGETFALLVNRNAPSKQAVIRSTEDAARQKGVQLHVLEAFTQDEIAAAFSALLRLDASGLVVVDAPWWATGAFIANLAARHRVPAIYGWSANVWVGGLVAYGPSRTAEFRQIGTYIGKLLKGAEPSDLPVMQPAKFQLLINLKAAKALGLTVPRWLLAEADEINR